METIEIEEIHKLVLAIAVEFDRICTKYQIPYYMLGGTMLGAIRHKGFIPWDDDMDFGVPIEHFQRLIDILTSELPLPYRCCTYKNHPAVIHNFIKIENGDTCIDDKSIGLPLERKLGLNIDVFPLNRCVLGGKAEKKLRRRVDLLGKAYLQSVFHSNSKTKQLIKKCLRIITGGSPLRLQQDIEKRLLNINTGDCLGNLLGHWREKEIVPLAWYGNGVRYQFEETSFVGLQDYDKYLTRMYGDYMELPPKEKQVAHVDKVYLR